MALPLLLQYPRTTKGILEFLPLDKVWMKIFLTITNLTGQGLTNRCIYWRPVRMLLEPLNPKFHSGFEALCLSYNASFIEASIVNRTWTFCALQVQPLIFWDVIQYTTLYYIFFQICILADIPLSFLLDQFQLLLVINSSERSRIVFWNILWNKVLSRRPEISLLLVGESPMHCNGDRIYPGLGGCADGAWKIWGGRVGAIQRRSCTSYSTYAQPWCGRIWSPCSVIDVLGWPDQWSSSQRMFSFPTRSNLALVMSGQGDQTGNV